MVVYDRDGDAWEEITLLQHAETGRTLTREEVEDFFGPLSEEEP